MLNQLENYLLLKKILPILKKNLNKVEDIFTYFNITKEFFYSLVEKENAELALLIIIYKALNDGWIPDLDNENEDKFFIISPLFGLGQSEVIKKEPGLDVFNHCFYLKSKELGEYLIHYFSDIQTRVTESLFMTK